MENSDSCANQKQDATAEPYANAYSAATPSSSHLTEKIRTLARKQGSLSFSQFMQLALYDAEDGYYSTNTSQVGKDGDFYTSVSVGSLFGKILATRIARWWQENQKPQQWHILELGAHRGDLAHDILSSLKTSAPDCYASLCYVIVEPLSKIRSSQTAKLHEFTDKVQLSETLEEISPLPGVFLSNELIDALPFHLIRKIDSIWRELRVTHELSLMPVPISADSKLKQRISALPDELPEGYETEVRLGVDQLLENIARTITSGMMIFIDYGFAAPEYYDTYRVKGTMRTFKNHQAGENPLSHIGQQDITAHVDFTDLAMHAIKQKFHPITFEPQGSYLVKNASSLIHSGELSSSKEIRQLQSLTHPSHLGASFHVLELEKGAKVTPAITHRLAL